MNVCRQAARSASGPGMSEDHGRFAERRLLPIMPQGTNSRIKDFL